MGYACPVCDAAQVDGEHLANHLAFSALLHGGDHEAWLDEHVGDWTERGPDGLAADATELAEETEVETVFEDETGGRHPRRGTPDPGGLDPETRRIVEEAMDLTRERRSDADGED